MPSHTPWDIPADWPAPDNAARALSERLVERIRAEMDASGGCLDFSRYMSLALYAPGLGYYSAGTHKIGAQGDFVTAPEISPLFARCIAQTCVSIFDQLGTGDIVELGAGTGALAAELLRELAALGRLPERYRILEPSADLRERQRLLLQRSVPAYIDHVEWLDTPPAEPWRGLLLANEVLDALPVHLFRWTDEALVELCVTWSDRHFAWATHPAGSALHDTVQTYAEQFGWTAAYTSEMNLLLSAWLQAVTEQQQTGAALFIDYGYARREYYHIQRAQGSLLCHYRHRAHADPLLLPGLQDITAHVDFTALAEAALTLDFQLNGYVTQAHFLLDAGIEKLLAAELEHSQTDYLRQAAQAKTLLLPGEMGERFKCMLLGRGLTAPVAGFRGRDLRDRL